MTTTVPVRVIQANLGHAAGAATVRNRLEELLPPHGRWAVLACEAHRLVGQLDIGGTVHQKPFDRRKGVAWRNPDRGRAEVALITGPGVAVERSECVKIMDGPKPPTKFQSDRWAWLVWATVDGARVLFVSSHFQANIQRRVVAGQLQHPLVVDYADGVAELADRIAAEMAAGWFPLFGADLNYRRSPQPWRGDPYNAFQRIGLATRAHRIDAISSAAVGVTWSRPLEVVAGSVGTDHRWLVGAVRVMSEGESVPGRVVPDPLERVTFRGRTMDRKTAAALAVAERRLGYELTVTQGSYNAGGVGASAGTHDRGGVVDLAPFDYERKVRVLRGVGFAAWFRPAIAGLWADHIHAVLIGHQDLSPAAAAQVVAYQNGLNGLANGAPDPNTFRPNVEPFNFAAAWRDDLLRERITGIGARMDALRDKASALKARITYRGGVRK